MFEGKKKVSKNNFPFLLQPFLRDLFVKYLAFYHKHGSTKEKCSSRKKCPVSRALKERSGYGLL